MTFRIMFVSEIRINQLYMNDINIIINILMLTLNFIDKTVQIF